MSINLDAGGGVPLLLWHDNANNHDLLHDYLLRFLSRA
ncbi:hypothetical protein Z948_3101 [Sulfitobacter donghicola DSW-25 = KCTC 12864 = JCM 14565]|nr:hypothetical protein Z948_3101 [Sulfitobacter donghicola DSW-25 = KCTC 12864 = JCM 14565]